MNFFDILVEGFVVLCDELVKYDGCPTKLDMLQAIFFSIFYIKNLAKFNKK
jgi:hypothetical protein